MKKTIDNYWLKMVKEGIDNDPEEYKRILIWYICFLIIFPLSVIYIFGFNNLRFYFSIIDIIANIFASTNDGKWMGKLYSILPLDLISYLSTNFISLLAIVGTSWIAIYHAFETKSIFTGVLVSAILFTFTYLLPIQGVSYFIEKISLYVDKNTKITDISSGFIILFILLLLENIFVFIYLHYLYKASK
jgi:hypothetical protein